MKRQRKRAVNFQMDEKSIQELNRVATSLKMRKGETLRMLIDLGIDCHKDMEKMGIIQAVDFTYFVKKALRDKLNRPESQQLHLL